MMQASSNPSPHQSALTAVELTLKDGLRALGFNLHLGAHWLVDDVAPRLAQQIDPVGASGTRETLHALAGSAARGTLSTLESVQHRAAIKAMADEPYRTLDFTLLPLAAYFSAQARRNPSGLFAEVFYWLMHHALVLEPAPRAQRALVQQRFVDEAFWIVQSDRARRAAPIDANQGFDQQGAAEHAALCAQLLRALIATRPIRDATVLPWTPADATAAESLQWRDVLLGVVLAAGSVTPSDVNHARAAACLRLGRHIATARQTPFAQALAQCAADGGAQLAAEFAFVFRHL